MGVVSEAKEEDIRLIDKSGSTIDSASDGKMLHQMDRPHLTVDTNLDSVEDVAPDFPSWGLAILVYFIVGCSSLSVGAPVPLLPAMISELWDFDDSSASFVYGVLDCSYQFTRFLSFSIVGHLSDRWGRRTVILLGLMSSLICLSTFGLSTTFWMALANRLLNGLTDANVAVSKAYLSDLTLSYPSIKAEVFAYHGAAFSLARALGSGLSGLSTLIAPLGVMKYELPCLLASAPILLTALISYWCLKETWQPQPKTVELTSMSPTTTIHDEEKCETSTVLEESECKTNNNNGFIANLRLLISEPVYARLLVIYSMNSLCNGATVTLLAVFPSHDCKYNGLGFDPAQVGTVFLVFGLTSFVYQVVCFRKMASRFHLRQIYLFGILCAITGVLSLPMTGQVMVTNSEGDLQPGVASYLLLLLSVLSLSVAFMTMLPVCNTMLSNCTSADTQGISAGASMSCSSLARGFGPLAAGALFAMFSTAPGGTFVPFVSLSVIYAVCLVIDLRLPESVETPYEWNAARVAVDSDSAEEAGNNVGS